MDRNDKIQIRSAFPAWVNNMFRRNKEYGVIDKIILLYVAVMLFFQILLQISPVMTFLATTPLYNIQTYLGLLGGFLILVDLCTSKRIWQGKCRLLLYAILVLAAFASVRMISYGIKENLFKLCWAAIQFVLVYSCAYRLDRESLKKYIKALYYLLVAIWFIACCISLYQYVNQIGYMYVVNPLAQDSSSNRQGFYDNRLFGIFYTLNHAAYISLFFFLIGIAFTAGEKRLWVKICLIVVEIVLLSYIILSGSRSVFLSLVVSTAVMGWFISRNTIKKKGFVKAAVPVVASVLAVMVCIGGYQGMKTVLSHIPYLNDFLAYHMQTEPADPTGAPAETPNEEPTKPTVAKPERDEDILVRDHLDEDVSNGRLSIWADYVSLFDDIGLVGLSPGNYMPYILENHPELYIVEYIRVNYPDKYDSGIIYHVHSGYMMVYVSAGILGILCLAAFIILCMIQVIRTVWKNQRLSYLFIGAFALVVSGAISAALDEGIFFQNNPHTTMFWLSVGVLMCGGMATEEGDDEQDLCAKDSE